jgi:hypothetical protein
VRVPPPAGADVRHAVRRELLRLVVAVVLLHALFIAGFYVLRVEHTSSRFRVGYTAAWTIATLVVALRALTRIRRLRGR